MYYHEDCTYHVYNRSNELLFYTCENYIFFLKKLRANLSTYCTILAYCLMPNHFHLLVKITSEGSKLSLHKAKETMQYFPFAIGSTLSSYTQAINKQQNRKGGLFAHRTRAKMLNDMGDDYLLRCFLYIHQNPLQACLVDKLEDWEFSSYPDYIGV